MSKLNVECNKCESVFIIKYSFDDVIREPTYCPFCSEAFKIESDELDFSDDNKDHEYYDEDEEDDG